ncbi:MAG TPA: tetratricopeptide repeat protein [Longimicrobiaceae bacterium]|nr:tetratricopeptide repeat protein [Longimicrobiaceae bacterium]
MKLVPALALCLLPAACVPAVRRGPPTAAGYPEAVSLLGQPLYAPEPPTETRTRLEAQLAQARAEYERYPNDADALIWYGRRTAYLGRYREAITIFSEGIKRHPRDPRMYRHRGHRFITTRRFARAAADLERAARLIRGTRDEVEPDGMPNAAGVPTSTLHGNIWYHLGLAYYLRGDYRRALNAFREAMEVARNDDSRVATSDWLYMTLRRLGRHEEARRVLEPIRREMTVLENHAYHRRLLMYKGELPPDSLLDPSGKDAVEIATQGYGVGNWYYYNGEVARAEQIFRQVVSAENWAPFGYIAAEADLRRMRREGRPRQASRE